MKSTLILGYGNIDRQDDGVAWHVLATLLQRLGRYDPAMLTEGIEIQGENPDFLFVLQLTPELAEIIAKYERVCFVDAHTGNYAENVMIGKVEQQYQPSSFTHHMTPATCMALCETLYHQAPEAILVSVRGLEFEFTHQLSQLAAEYVEKAAASIWGWMFA